MTTELDEALGEAPKAEDAAEPVVEEPKAEEEAPEVPEAEEPSKESTVPLAALLEERSKRQSLERQNLERQLEAARPSEPTPDVLEDPDGYAKHMQSSVESRVQTERLNLSEEMARMHYGDDVVDAAMEAFAPKIGTPQHQLMLAERNPYRALVNWHKQQQVLAEVGDDPVKWAEQQREKIRQEVEAEAAVKQVRAPKAPTLAAEPNLGVRSGPGWTGPTPLDQAIGE